MGTNSKLLRDERRHESRLLMDDRSKSVRMDEVGIAKASGYSDSGTAASLMRGFEIPEAKSSGDWVELVKSRIRWTKSVQARKAASPCPPPCPHPVAVGKKEKELSRTSDAGRQADTVGEPQPVGGTQESGTPESGAPERRAGAKATVARQGAVVAAQLVLSAFSASDDAQQDDLGGQGLPVAHFDPLRDAEDEEGKAAGRLSRESSKGHPTKAAKTQSRPAEPAAADYWSAPLDGTSATTRRRPGKGSSAMVDDDPRAALKMQKLEARAKARKAAQGKVGAAGADKQQAATAAASAADAGAVMGVDAWTNVLTEAFEGSSDEGNPDARMSPTPKPRKTAEEAGAEVGPDGAAGTGRADGADPDAAKRSVDDVRKRDARSARGPAQTRAQAGGRTAPGWNPESRVADGHGAAAPQIPTRASARGPAQTRAQAGGRTAPGWNPESRVADGHSAAAPQIPTRASARGPAQTRAQAGGRTAPGWNPESRVADGHGVAAPQIPTRASALEPPARTTPASPQAHADPGYAGHEARKARGSSRQMQAQARAARREAWRESVRHSHAASSAIEGAQAGASGSAAASGGAAAGASGGAAAGSGAAAGGGAAAGAAGGAPVLLVVAAVVLVFAVLGSAISCTLGLATMGGAAGAASQDEARAPGGRSGQAFANWALAEYESGVADGTMHAGGADYNGHVKLWCADFVCFGWEKLGYPETIGFAGSHTAYGWISGTKDNPSFGEVLTAGTSYKPQPGDIIVQGTSGSGTHVGIVVSALGDDGKFRTVEGNYGDRVDSAYYSPEQNSWNYVFRPNWPTGAGEIGEGVDFSMSEKEFVKLWGDAINKFYENATGWGGEPIVNPPLAGHGEEFARAAYKYQYDPRMSPAISIYESNGGKACFHPHNAWGWGQVSWSSWSEAINAHVKGLFEGYSGMNLHDFFYKYAPPSENRTDEYIGLIRAALEQMGEYAGVTTGGESIVLEGGLLGNPLTKQDYRISSPFGYREFGGGEFHKGIDMAIAVGSPYYAAADGTVLIAGWSDSAGNWIVIDHGGGLITSYMHSSAIHVSAGQAVKRGEHIGDVGTTGHSTGPHLHFQVSTDGTHNGAVVDPMDYLQ